MLLCYCEKLIKKVESKLKNLSYFVGKPFVSKHKSKQNKIEPMKKNEGEAEAKEFIV